MDHWIGLAIRMRSEDFQTMGPIGLDLGLDYTARTGFNAGQFSLCVSSENAWPQGIRSTVKDAVITVRSFRFTHCMWTDLETKVEPMALEVRSLRGVEAVLSSAMPTPRPESSSRCPTMLKSYLHN